MRRRDAGILVLVGACVLLGVFAPRPWGFALGFAAGMLSALVVVSAELRRTVARIQAGRREHRNGA